MPKSILIYGNFGQYSATEFIMGIDELLEENPNAELQVPINSNGGEVDYGWGMVHKFQQFPNKKSVIIHGKAYSMALYFACYTEDVSSLDVAEFLLHRAAYSEWVENDPELFNEDRRNSLTQMNKKLRAAFEAKVDVEKFLALKVMKDKGYTLDDIFSLDNRIDIRFNAKEAKAIGLVKTIVTITPKIESLIEANFKIAAQYNEGATHIENDKNKNKPLIKNKMTKAELKAEHPALYAEIYNEGITAGTTAEKDRVEAIMEFVDVDPELVKTVIASGKDLTKAQTNNLLLKAVKGQKVDEIAADGKTPIVTGAAKDEATKKAEEAKAAEEKFMKDVRDGI